MATRNRKLKFGDKVIVPCIKWDHGLVVVETEIVVGESGASYGINGDRYPATIIGGTVGPDGRAKMLLVQADRYTVNPGGGGQYEGPKPCTFARNPDGRVRKFCRNHEGDWVEVGSRCWFLDLGREYAQNPHV